jgi:DNA primase
MVIKPSLIDEVRSKRNLLEVVASFTKLSKVGTLHVARCPLHPTTTQSFVVNNSKQVWHCSECGLSGNIFTFVRQIKKVSFVESVAFLLNPNNPGLLLEMKGNGELTRLNDKVAEFYSTSLLTPLGAPALLYLQNRGIGPLEIDKWKLGFSSPNGRLISHLINLGFSEDLLLKSGLVIKNEDSYIYDRFRNRIIFPLKDANGSICAFSGRVFDDTSPKYMHQTETSLFSKAAILYGWDQAKDFIGASNQVILTEGFMDVIIPHKYGFKNVVASLGATLTAGQVRLLTSIADCVYVCYDSDKAGEAACLRAVSLLRQEGVVVKVIHLSHGCKDPDELITKHSAEAFKSCVEAAAVVRE